MAADALRATKGQRGSAPRAGVTLYGDGRRLAKRRCARCAVLASLVLVVLSFGCKEKWDTTHGLREVVASLAEWLDFQASIWHEITTPSSAASARRPSRRSAAA